MKNNETKRLKLSYLTTLHPNMIRVYAIIDKYTRRTRKEVLQRFKNDHCSIAVNLPRNIVALACGDNILEALQDYERIKFHHVCLQTKK